MNAAKRGVLNIYKGDVFVGRLHMVGTRLVLGRSPDADVVLDSDTASRQHAELAKDERGRWWVRDLNSVNGTIVNNAEVRAHMLRSGDVIKIASFELRYAEARPERQVARPQPLHRTRVTITDGSGVIRALRELETPKIDASHLSGLIEFSGSLLATQQEGERLRALCELMLSAKFQGTSAVVFRLKRRVLDRIEPEVLFGPVPASPVPPYISRSALRAVLTNESPVLASNTQNARQDAVEMSMMVTEMSAVVCPVGKTDKTIDLLYVTLPVHYGTAEWLALSSLAAEQFEQAQTAWVARELAQKQAAVEQELARANEIQMGLVPTDFSAGGVDIGFGFEPSKWVGGDYVDAFETPDGRIFLTVMDVCGKGLQAALIATSLHTSVHLLMRQGLELAAIIKTLNSHLVRTLPDDSYVTMVAAVLDPRSGHLECVNCGHPPPMMVSPGGLSREVNAAEHVPLGFIEMDVTSAEDELLPGYLLAAYSDGLSELENESEEQLGSEGVARMIGEIFRASRSARIGRASVGRSATALSAALRDRLEAYRGEAVVGDDTSFVIAVRSAGGPTRMQTQPTFLPTR